MLFLNEWNYIIGSVTWPPNFLPGLVIRFFPSFLEPTVAGSILPRENSMPDQEGHSYVKFRLDWPPLLGPVTSFFSLAVQPTLQDTDHCSVCSCAVVDRKFNGQIVYRSKGVRVGQHQHRGNKWKKDTCAPMLCLLWSQCLPRLQGCS